MATQRTPVTLPEFPPSFVLVGSLILAILSILLVVYISRSRSSSKKNLILLLGNEDAGKSAILSSIVYEHTLPTHTSFQVNSSYIPESFLGKKKQLQLVDVPGHLRLRNSFKTYISDAKALVFVVDASTITRNGRDVAEHLHHILHALTSLPPTQALPPLLILAHKSDLLSSPSSSSSHTTQTASSLAISRTRTILERELEKRRQASLGGVSIEGLSEIESTRVTTGDSSESAELGGLECSGKGGVFRFAEWEGGEVGFAASYVKVGQFAKFEKTEAAESIEKGASGSAETEGVFAGLDELRVWLEELS